MFDFDAFFLVDGFAHFSCLCGDCFLFASYDEILGAFPDVHFYCCLRCFCVF